jgi:hypothetical protein
MAIKENWSPRMDVAEPAQSRRKSRMEKTLKNEALRVSGGFMFIFLSTMMIPLHSGFNLTMS